MLKTVVVEDEENLLHMLVYFLNAHPAYEVVGAFSNPEEALKEFPTLAPDILFLDIAMPKMNGIELATHIQSDNCQLVFTTAYTHYALDALKLEASDYLLKPIMPENIEAITPKLLKKHKMQQMYNEVNDIRNKKEPFIHCFGTFTVFASQEQAIKWPTRKVEELFAYLLTHHQCIVNKWRLSEDLWPNKGMNNIYNSVYLLNKTLKEFHLPIRVVNKNEGYMLEFLEKVKVDMHAFQNLTDEDVSTDEAMDLMCGISKRGSLFSDKDYAWATLYREQYNVKHHTIMLQFIKHYEKKDAYVYKMLQKEYELLYGE
ncbi:response regulator [Caryophanon latum]|uniref:Response regulatory domain-containing protein n=1 Tax=Caryophanon latum TaxID=33977 RepID=A0A1C0YZT3_9BACL|nr:response regulator [Caryophanon latum]OCS92671.1 hypothetical protein A6K76_06225 [Caryophanon latum]